MHHLLHPHFVSIPEKNRLLSFFLIFFFLFLPHVTLKMINDSFYDDYSNLLNLTSEDAYEEANATVNMAPGHEINWFEWATEGVLILIIGILGLLGNCISIWSFSRQKVHRIFHNLLLILAIFDIVSYFKVYIR